MHKAKEQQNKIPGNISFYYKIFVNAISKKKGETLQNKNLKKNKSKPAQKKIYNGEEYVKKLKRKQSYLTHTHLHLHSQKHMG